MGARVGVPGSTAFHTLSVSCSTCRQNSNTIAGHASLATDQCIIGVIETCTRTAGGAISRRA